MASKPPVKPPHQPRVTIEVEASWLEPGADDDAPPVPGTEPRTSAAPTRRLSKASLPRVSIMPRRETMEVQADWLEADDEQAGPAGRRSTRSMPAVKKTATPPLPPEAPRQVKSRQAWEPPTLPPPPPTAAKARRALPPPLPRGDDEPAEPPKRSSRKPPRS